MNRCVLIALTPPTPHIPSFLTDYPLQSGCIETWGLIHSLFGLLASLDVEANQTPTGLKRKRETLPYRGLLQVCEKSMILL